MIIFAIELTGYGSIRRIAVSLPYAPELVDHVKYLEPEDMPRLQGTELRRQRAPRGPSLRSLVRLALRCESAEQMGQKLKRRFDRSLRRQGIDPNRSRQRQAELDRLLTQV